VAAPFPNEPLNLQTFRLPAELAEDVRLALEDWQQHGRVAQLWKKEARLWKGRDEGNWMGWLELPQLLLQQAGTFAEIAEDVRRAGFEHALLLGMGGSSMCPEVLAAVFGPQPGFPFLHVLDSTDPAQVRSFEQKINPAKTLYIVASKSGSTLEPNILKQYFFDRAGKALGKPAGVHFLAITDPGSKLEQAARAEGFRRIALGVPSVGGRYSALSNFGMVPAAVMGLDVPRILERARDMAVACGADVPAGQNPGVILGAILGVAARHGRDKVTFIASPRIAPLGAWLEQLLAESTGKDNKAILPVDREAVDAPEVYGNDRLFVYLRMAGATDNAQESALDAIEQAGHPVVRIHIQDAYHLGQEFFRWAIATAVAGSILGIHPFDQPDVEAAKMEARKLTEAYEQSGRLPAESPLAQEGGLKLFTDSLNAAELAHSGALTVPEILRSHLCRILPGDYFAILAYLEMNEINETILQEMRHAVRDARVAATCLGFGPRFLHSTGQAYKGGPNSGVFLQITCDDAADVLVPGQAYTFGVVKAAQARGDFEVLAARKRRALRVHLGADVKAGLERLNQLVQQALQ
jgi:glucose-6-phosphate isomerase